MSDSESADFTAFVTPESKGERIQFEGCDVHVVHYGAGTKRGNHTHEETNIVFMRLGEMQLGVDSDLRETKPGDTNITPGDDPHS